MIEKGGVLYYKKGVTCVDPGETERLIARLVRKHTSYQVRRSKYRGKHRQHTKGPGLRARFRIPHRR